MSELNSNPEILLRKRKNADRLRIEKQEAARKRNEEALRKKNKKKFQRAETILAKKISTEKESKRLHRVSKIDKTKIKLLSAESEKWNEKPTLLFVVRVKSSTNSNSKIPPKAFKILEALRLDHINNGVFVKLNTTVLPLLKMIAPYVVIGSPSLATIRELVQKRGKAKIDRDNSGTKVEVPLNDNSIIEDVLGDLGIICTEDIVHELYTLGDNFKQVVNFLRPFQLAPPVTGWGPLAKLKRMELRSEKESTKTSMRASAALTEVDIDKYVAELN